MIAQTDISQRYVQANGVRLHVAQAGPEDGPPLVLLHGFPEFWFGWRRQIPYFAARGYRVYAPDQRGYNLSEKPTQVSDYRLDTLATDIDALAQALGHEQVYLVGHDWGAVVAWWTAIQYPGRVRKLGILNVPHPAVMQRNLTSNIAQMLKSWYIYLFQLPWLPEQFLLSGNTSIFTTTSNRGSFTNDDLRAYREAWRQPGAATGMLQWYRALLRHFPEAPSSDRVTMPTLILWGKNDVALQPELASQSLAYCDDGRLVMFDDATHWVQHDAAERVNALLGEFLA